MGKEGIWTRKKTDRRRAREKENRTNGKAVPVRGKWRACAERGSFSLAQRGFTVFHQPQAGYKVFIERSSV